jgi:hypothetical protein
VKKKILVQNKERLFCFHDGFDYLLTFVFRKKITFICRGKIGPKRFAVGCDVLFFWNCSLKGKLLTVVFGIYSLVAGRLQ